jgi:hypothetical protein
MKASLDRKCAAILCLVGKYSLLPPKFEDGYVLQKALFRSHVCIARIRPFHTSIHQ